jgi:membrane protein implicated in regulation of membrane protease activity
MLAAMRAHTDIRQLQLRFGLVAPIKPVDGEIALNGTTWRIKSFLDTGDEVRLILMQGH